MPTVRSRPDLARRRARVQGAVAAASGQNVRPASKDQKALIDRPESAILREIMRYLHSLPGCAAIRQNVGAVATGRRWVRFGIKGQSDILACYRGRFLAIEVKRRLGKPTEEQIAFMEWIRDAGGHATVARSVADVVSWFRGIGLDLA